MKVLIISDTHGNNDIFTEVIVKEGKPDLVIHLGDALGCEYYYPQVTQCPVEIISGNSDIYTLLPPEKVLELEGNRIFMAHGHRHMVHAGTMRIEEAARKYDADIVMFGHTHEPMIKEENGMIFLNPGSLAKPRQPDGKHTYIMMTTNWRGKPKFELKSLED